MIYALKDNVPSEDVKWGNTALEANFTNGSNLLMQGYFDPSKGTTGARSGSVTRSRVRSSPAARR